MQRFGQRQGFLVSAIIHLTLLMILISHKPDTDRRGPEDLLQREHTEKIFMPSAAELRKLLPEPATPRPAPRTVSPVPPPMPEQERLRQKDRISIGPPVAVRQEGPLILRREDDLTKVPRGAPTRCPLRTSGHPFRRQHPCQPPRRRHPGPLPRLISPG